MRRYLSGVVNVSFFLSFEIVFRVDPVGYDWICILVRQYLLARILWLIVGNNDILIAAIQYFSRLAPYWRCHLGVVIRNG